MNQLRRVRQASGPRMRCGTREHAAYRTRASPRPVARHMRPLPADLTRIQQAPPPGRHRRTTDGRAGARTAPYVTPRRNRWAHPRRGPQRLLTVRGSPKTPGPPARRDDCQNGAAAWQPPAGEGPALTPISVTSTFSTTPSPKGGLTYSGSLCQTMCAQQSSGRTPAPPRRRAAPADAATGRGGRALRRGTGTRRARGHCIWYRARGTPSQAKRRSRQVAAVRPPGRAERSSNCQWPAVGSTRSLGRLGRHERHRILPSGPAAARRPPRAVVPPLCTGRAAVWNTSDHRHRHT